MPATPMQAQRNGNRRYRPQCCAVSVVHSRQWIAVLSVVRQWLSIVYVIIDVHRSIMYRNSRIMYIGSSCGPFLHYTTRLADKGVWHKTTSTNSYTQCAWQDECAELKEQLQEGFWVSLLNDSVSKLQWQSRTLLLVESQNISVHLSDRRP